MVKPRMIRKQVYIEPRQDALLKSRSTELGITEAELIRQCIDRLAETGHKAEREAAWGRLLAVMEERARLKVPKTGWKWNREDIYEERLGRYSR